MPKYGSLYTPFSTRTAKTVFGADVLYQLDASKPAEEIASALALTFAEDCTAHPSRRVISPSALERGAAIAVAARSAATKLTAARKFLRFQATRSTSLEKKFSFLPSNMSMSSPTPPSKRRHLNRFNGANSLHLLSLLGRALV